MGRDGIHCPTPGSGTQDPWHTWPPLSTGHHERLVPYPLCYGTGPSNDLGRQRGNREGVEREMGVNRSSDQAHGRLRGVMPAGNREGVEREMGVGRSSDQAHGRLPGVMPAGNRTRGNPAM